MGIGSNKTVVNSSVPGYIQQEGQQNYALADQIANRPYDNNNIQVAGFNGTQNAAFQGINGQVGQAAQQLAPAQQIAQSVGNYNPQMVTAGSPITQGNLANYMNPYAANVINPAIQLQQQQTAQAINGNNAQAATAGAFGGSRLGVQNAVAQSQGALNLSQLEGNLLNQNFNQATGLAEQDASRNLQAQTQNQQAGLAGQQLNLAGAGTLGNLAALNTGLSSQELNNQLQAGSLQQQNAQQQLNANWQNEQNQFNYPIQGLQLREGALASQPYGTNQTTQGPAGNPITGALGGAGIGASIGGPWGAGVGAVLGGVGSIFSDQRYKTDIEHMGEVDLPTGGKLAIKAYRYKGDKKNTPKIVGPMAQDVEKAMPGSTAQIGAKKMMVIHPQAASIISNAMKGLNNPTGGSRIRMGG